MRLVVGSESFPLFESIQSAGIGDIRDIRKITKGLIDPEDNGGVPFQGVTPKTFSALFEVMTETAKAKAAALKAGVDAPDDDDPAFDDLFFLHMQSLVWLARRKAGLQVTFDECNVPADGFTFAADPEDVEVDEAPKDSPADVVGV